uniref:Amidase domain-containing protein n=1 Tax=Apteryx owenii TaxID=8824 RepID=A0A8B9S8X7_APTOW
MICEKVKQLLSGFRDNPCSVPILVCSSTAALMALAWAVRKLMKRKFVRAKHHAEALEQMEKAVQQFKKENPDVQTSHILSLPLTELVEKLREGSLSPESVLYSYIEKALEVNQEVNCVTAFIPSCLHHIQEMRNQKKGLLYGVPISIKDHVACKVFPLVPLFGKLSVLLEQEESVLVRVLRSQGAIPFVKTNTAQCVINNAIYGQTLNPLNHKKSPGGCSGGEGALIAGGGSILGIGLDIGGSIRLPSSFCGLCGLKPTSDRLSSRERRRLVHPGIHNNLLTLSGQVYRWEFITRWKNLDPDVILCPVLGPAFTLGYLETNLGKPQRAGDVWTGSTGSPPNPFGGREIHENPCGSPSFVSTYLKPSPLIMPIGLEDISRDPEHQKYISCWEGFKELLLALGCSASACMVWALVFEAAGCESTSECFWHITGLTCAPRISHSFPPSSPDSLSSTMLYNILNFPAGVVPVTVVTEADEEQLQLYSGYLDGPWDKKLRKVRKTAVGLPVAVQCVALPWQELCLRFMKEVERLTSEPEQQSWRRGTSLAMSFSLLVHFRGENRMSSLGLKLFGVKPAWRRG